MKQLTPQEIAELRSTDPQQVLANAVAARMAFDATWNAGINPQAVAPAVEALKSYVDDEKAAATEIYNRTNSSYGCSETLEEYLAACEANRPRWQALSALYLSPAKTDEG